jgi:hypothetical protein
VAHNGSLDIDGRTFGRSTLVYITLVIAFYANKQITNKKECRSAAAAVSVSSIIELRRAQKKKAANAAAFKFGDLEVKPETNNLMRPPQ